MAQPHAFSPRTVLWLIAVGSLCFAGAAYLSIYGGESTAGANSYSYSAIGHRAFVETLKRVGVPIVVSGNDSRAKAGRTALLVLAEPELPDEDDHDLTEMLSADTLLLVLPKWQGAPDASKPHWLASAALLPLDEVNAILRLVLAEAEVRRAGSAPTWNPGTLAIAPTLAVPQLVEAPGLEPIVASDHGILVGELRRGRQRLWILSDPDVLSNHGLGRGDNAVLALALVDSLRPRGGTVVLDETIHGFRQNPSLWQAMFEYPFVVATLQAVAAALALIWAAAGRFGAPLPAERALKAGKETLLGNTAGLLQFGGHGPEILRRYREAAFRDVARRLRAPRHLGDDALVDWVDRVGEARGLRRRFADLRREVDAASAATGPGDAGLLRAARNIYRWKQEIVDGP